VRVARGFSLLEAVVSCALLAVTATLLFLTLNLGFKGFNLASTRMGVQGEMQTAVSRLQQDLELTTLVGVQPFTQRSVDLVLDSTVTTQARHILCLPGLSDWQPANGNAMFVAETGLPRWDRYLVYHSDLQTADSRLHRLEIDPGGVFGGSRWTDFSSYLSGYPGSPPVRGAIIGRSTVTLVRELTRHLLSFEVVKENTGVAVVLKMRARGRNPVEGGTSRDELLETRMRLVPRNQAY
jgi:hypothetical protein